MGKKSALVYELLRSEKTEDGFSLNEILHRVSETHGFTPGKGLRKQINAALKRGIDFGILTKQQNRYKFDLNVTPIPLPQIQFHQKNKRGKRKKRVSNKPKAQNNRKPRGRTRRPVRKPKDIRPVPTVPRPPNWTPKKRILREEPVPKFTKH